MPTTMRFYAVARGRQPGVYTDWFGCGGAQEQVNEFKGSRYKSFATLEEATAIVRSNAELLIAAKTPLPPDSHTITERTISTKSNGNRRTSWIMKVIVSYGALMVIGYFSLMYTMGY